MIWSEAEMFKEEHNLIKKNSEINTILTDTENRVQRKSVLQPVIQASCS